MATDAIAAGSRDLSLTDEEVTKLRQILESCLAETRVELHRTHTPVFRDKVKHEVTVLRGLVAKLHQGCA